MLVYKITNTINGKVYVGQTRQKLNVRFRQHGYKTSNCSLIYRAIVKHGTQAFKIEQIHTANSQSELDQKESYFINEFNSLSPNGYNLTSGGEGGYKRSKETRLKLSLAGKGKSRPHTPESKAKLSAAKLGSKNPQYGRSPSEETKRKLSEALTGRKRPEEVVAKIKASHNAKSDLNLTYRRKSQLGV